MSTKSVELELFKNDVFLIINLHHEAMSVFLVKLQGKIERSHC